MSHDGPAGPSEAWLDMARRASRAERDLVGAVLRRPAAMDDVAGTLPPGDFHDATLGLIWGECLAMYAEGTPAAPVPLAERLLRQGRLGQLGTAPDDFLIGLWDAGLAAPDPGYSAGLVRDFALLRGLARAGREIVRLAEDPVGPAAEALGDAERLVFGLAERGSSAGVVTLADAVEDACDRIIDRHGGGASGLPTGVGALDRLTAGLHPSELTVLAARPGVGKTAVALAVAANVARGGGRVLFSSLEMAGHELATRMLVSASGVPGQAVRQGNISDADAEALSRARCELLPLPVLLDDSAEQPVLRVAANARRLKRQGGLALVVVDYLQLVAPDDRRLPRHEQVAGVSRRLKALAKDLAVPVLALAQLNRESEARSGAKPKLSDLRESGSIEADADVVVLLHRNASGPEDALECIVAKNRNGPVGEVAVRFDRARMRFSDLASGANWKWP